MKKNQFLSLFFITCFVLCSICNVQAKRVLKVLAIGNSFSEDAVEQNLYQLTRAEGDSLVIGNAYIGGCSIDRHWENAQTGKSAYAYRKIVGGIKINEEGKSLKEIIKDENWDIITVQQASPLSGQYQTYNHLPNLIKYIRENAVNHKFRLAFHMTWAYAQNSKHPGFANYNKDQLTMYHDILNAVKQAVKKNKIKRIIPTGTAIQNARAVLGDTLCRDGHHLSLTIGRYIAACTWCEFLTGKNVTGNIYHPNTVSLKGALVAQKSAHNAIKQPYKSIK
jgi:hypothetical protein